MALAPTPKDTLHREGTASLYRFRRSAPAANKTPLLLVPSLINRWYILDLREGASLTAHLTEHFDTFCWDWGVPEDEDRYLDWDGVMKRLSRAVRKVKRISGAKSVALLGYCMGGTLAGIYTALEQQNVAALINLAGPFNFEEGGMLAHMTDPRWFDASAIAQAGNIDPAQMQSGFTALRPTLSLSKWVSLMTTGYDPQMRTAFDALETWSNDNTPFPAAAYETYISELYQQNLLIKGEHHTLGQRVDLKNITCPVLSIVAEKDTICPPKAASGLNESVSSRDQELYTCPGGHVGAVVGRRAAAKLYPKISQWLAERVKVKKLAPVN